MLTHKATHVGIKIGESNFGEFMVIRQICQCFSSMVPHLNVIKENAALLCETETKQLYVEQ